MIVDVARCQGCNNCLLSCKDEHVDNDWPGYALPQSRHGQRWIDVPCMERGQYPLIDLAYRPTMCMHCDDAPCVTASGGAIRKRADGIVLIDPKKAKGRRELVECCPYGMISWDEEAGVAQKCTLCAHLLDEGWKEPRCVQACGPGALSIVRLSDDEFAKLVEAEGLQPRVGGLSHGVNVYYRNLHRFSSCFIAGSAATAVDGVVDCAAGAVVTLSRPGSADALDRCVADAFGDYKFDGLPEGSGEYLVTIAYRDFDPATESAILGRSLNLGTTVFAKEAADVAR